MNIPRLSVVVFKVVVVLKCRILGYVQLILLCSCSLLECGRIFPELHLATALTAYIPIQGMLVYTRTEDSVEDTLIG